MVSQAVYGASVAVLEDRGEWTEDPHGGRLHRLDAVGVAPRGSAVRRFGPRGPGGQPVRQPLPRSQRDPTRAGDHAAVRGAPGSGLGAGSAAVPLDPSPPGRRARGVGAARRRPFDAKTAHPRADASTSASAFSVCHTCGAAPPRFGYDCSGFAQMLYRQTGVTMPRDAQPQADWGGLAGSPNAMSFNPATCCTSAARTERSATPASTWATASSSTRPRTNARWFRSTELDDPHLARRWWHPGD